MDVAGKLRELERKRVALTAAGGLGTVVCLCVLIWLTKWQELPGMAPNNVGDFLAGASAPLAFLWLVIGYFLQANELKQNSESLMQQAAEMRESVQAQFRQAEEAGQQGTYFRQDVLNKTRELFETELGEMAASFVKSGLIVEEGGISYGQPTWKQFASGDREVFTRLAVGCVESSSGEGWTDEYYDGSGRKLYLAHFDYFMSTLDRLGEREVAEMYRQRSFGQLYTALKHHEFLLQQVAY